MEKLKGLLDIKQEALKMDFSYQNIQRLLFLVYETKSLLESSPIIPNREIALHQTRKLIDNELIILIRSDGEHEIKIAFTNLLDNFKLILTYFS